MNRLNNNTKSIIAGMLPPAYQHSLKRINKESHRVVKPIYNNVMKKATNVVIKREQMIRNLKFLFIEIYDDEWITEWHDDFFVYMNIMGNKLNPALFEGLINSNRGFNILMKDIDMNTLIGFYSWMNGRLLDYMKMNYAIPSVRHGHETKKQFSERATSYMKRPILHTGIWS